MSVTDAAGVAPLKLRVNWEAHVEALPLPTFIIGQDAEASLSQDQDLIRGCEEIYVNQACREILGFASRDAPAVSDWSRYLHPEDRKACLVAWNDFLEGRSVRFGRTVRWIRPDTKATVTLAVRAQRLLCGDVQGWIRPTTVEQALSRLAELL